MDRRSLLQSALASVAISTPAGLAASSPAAASILKAAPYVPAPDTELLRLSARFFKVATEQEEMFQRYCAMDRESPESRALDEQIQGLYLEWAGAAETCYAIAPTTLAGAAALLDVILERDADFIDENPKKALRMLYHALTNMVQA